MNAFYEHHQDNIRFGYRCFDRILLNVCIAKFKNEQVGLRSDYFQRMGIGRRTSLRMASGVGYSQFLTAELAARTWLLVAIDEANQRVHFFPQKLTQAASV